MPFIHWGTEATLLWRDEKLSEIAELRKENPTGPISPSNGKDDSPMYQFYTKMIAEQLFPEGPGPATKPLHLRRTLDQFYYSHGEDTKERDYDQVVAKYGPYGHLGKPHRLILTVDQLWLWIIGKGKPLILSLKSGLTREQTP